jgi:hypothetical protein
LSLAFPFLSFPFFYPAFMFVPASLFVCRCVHARTCGARTALTRLNLTARGKKMPQIDSFCLIELNRIEKSIKV